MKLNLKNGYVLVRDVNASELLTYPVVGVNCAKIEHGAEGDLGVIIFYKDSIQFSDDLKLVKTEDVLLWIKDEPVIVESVEQVA